MYTLKDSEELDKIMTQVFSNEKSTIIGFSFSSDTQMLTKCLPQMNFYRHIKSFLDLQTYYQKVFKVKESKKEAAISLSKVVLELTGKSLCKSEQCSNW